MHFFFNCTTKNHLKMAKTLIEFAKWRPTQNLLFGRLHFMIYTHNRFGRFVPFRSVFLSRSLARCVYFFCCLICVWLCVCVYKCIEFNMKHKYTHAWTRWYVFDTHSHTHKNAFVLCGCFCSIPLAYSDCCCGRWFGVSRVCLHVVPFAPIHWVLALLLLLLFYRSLALSL